MVVILGPEGVGKSSVARRFAGEGSSTFLYLDTQMLKEEVIKRVRRGKWSKMLYDSPALVLDGPTYLVSRPGAEMLIMSLIRTRVKKGLHTILCDVSGDGSVDCIMENMAAGSMVVLGLRFPKSRSGRMRFARRQCDVLGIPRACARGTDAIEPWRYDAVIRDLMECKSLLDSGKQLADIGREPRAGL